MNEVATEVVRGLAGNLALLLLCVVLSSTPAIAQTDLAKIEEIINQRKERKLKYVPRPVLSTKDTKLLLRGRRITDNGSNGFASLPASYDGRAFDTSVKDQGQEGLCTAFAVVAAMETNGLSQKKAYNLSEKHLWSMYRQYYTTSALNAAYLYWTTLESIWPYSSSRPSRSVVPVAKATGYRALPTWSDVYGSLAAGEAVVLSVVTNDSWSNPYYGVLQTTGTQQGGHAVKVSGWLTSKRGRYLIIKNSWSNRYGDNGYVYMPEAYCSKFWCEFHKLTGTKFQ